MVLPAVASPALKESYLFRLRETRKGLPDYLVATFDVAHEAMQLASTLLESHGAIIPELSLNNLHVYLSKTEKAKEVIDSLVRSSRSSFWPTRLYFLIQGAQRMVNDFHNEAQSTLDALTEASSTALSKVSTSPSERASAHIPSLALTSSSSPPSQPAPSLPPGYTLMAVPLQYANLPGIIPLLPFTIPTSLSISGPSALDVTTDGSNPPGNGQDATQDAASLDLTYNAIARLHEHKSKDLPVTTSSLAVNSDAASDGLSNASRHTPWDRSSQYGDKIYGSVRSDSPFVEAIARRPEVIQGADERHSISPQVARGPRRSRSEGHLSARIDI